MQIISSAACAFFEENIDFLLDSTTPPPFAPQLYRIRGGGRHEPFPTTHEL